MPELRKWNSLCVMENFIVVDYFNDDDKRYANINILNEVARVLISYIDGDTESDDFLSNIWDIACLCMMEVNMNIVGINADNNYIAKFNVVNV